MLHKKKKKVFKCKVIRRELLTSHHHHNPLTSNYTHTACLLNIIDKDSPTCALYFIPACLFKNITLRSLFCVSHIKKKKKIYHLFLVALGPHGCQELPPDAASGGYSPVTVLRFLISAAFLVAEHGLSFLRTCRSLPRSGI